MAPKSLARKPRRRYFSPVNLSVHHALILTLGIIAAPVCGGTSSNQTAGSTAPAPAVTGAPETARVATAPVPAPDPATTAALQAALDRYGFGVGFVDGKAGPRTEQAFRDYLRATGLSTREARQHLLDDDAAVTPYAVTGSDLARVGSAPEDWLEAAAVPAMTYRALDEALAEKFHVSRPWLQRLNPGITNWAAVTPGTRVDVPNTRPEDWTLPASRLEVDCATYRLRVYDADNDLVASFPCSIARQLHKVPTGDLTIVSFAPNPNYTFDPANFPESPRARDIGRKLIIPPGPRNPVGVYWLTLSAAGFGMHGTPRPETIGRRESHGCFRLTNWDITTLARMVGVGTPVRVVGLTPGAE
jgi:lipoprotein-anchoring transpeptidase ErfK/SrfK